MSTVKIISQEIALQSKSSFSVNRTTLQLPSGKILEHYNAYRVPTVSIFALTTDYDIYLVSQYRYILDEITLEAPAGRVEEGENVLVTAKRELQEEAGIIANNFTELLVIDAAGSFIQAVSYLYLARDLTIGKQSLEEEEEGLQVIKMSLDEAIEGILGKKIKTSSTICGILLLDKLRKEGKI